MYRKKILLEKYLYGCIYFFLIVFAFNLRVTLPASGVDPSWIQALCYATKQHLVWGKDIIFTYGPWHMMATRAYHPEFYWMLVFSQIYIWLLLGWRFKEQYKNPVFCLLLLLCTLLYFVIDTIYFAIAFIFFLQGLSQKRLDRIILCVFLLLSGFIALAKMNYLPLYIGLMLLADLYQITKHRNFPTFTISLVASFVGFWVLSGQLLTDLPIFIHSINPIISSYSEAMQITKGAGIFYAVSSINCIIVIMLLYSITKKRVFGEINNSIISKFGYVIIFMAAIFYQFMVIKSASTRLDNGHDSIAYASSLLMIMCLMQYLQVRININSNKLRKKQLVIALVVIINSVLIARASTPDPIFISARLLLNPSELEKEYNNKWQQLKEIAKSKLGGVEPEELKGVVDSYPAEITEILALNLNYSPRPTLQLYSSYDPELQIKDLAHLQGSNPPKYLFFKIGDSDGRFPVLTLGPSALEILKNYLVKDKTDLGLLLERRSDSLKGVLVASYEMNEKKIFNKPVMLPKASVNTIRMLAIDLNLTTLGKILKLIAKVPQVDIDVVNKDGVYSSRFIPPAARAGFLISPLLKDQEQAYELFQSIAESKPYNDDGVLEIKLRIKPKYQWAYRESAVIRLQDFRLENIKQ